MSIFSNEEWKKLIEQAKARKKAEEEKKRKQVARLERTTLTEDEEKQIRERVESELAEEEALEEEEERLRIEVSNKPKKLKIEYEITVKNETENKETTKTEDSEPSFEQEKAQLLASISDEKVRKSASDFIGSDSNRLAQIMWIKENKRIPKSCEVILANDKKEGDNKNE